MTLPYPDKIALARLPTPLEPLERASEALGVELWIKRDDMTGVELSGNKVRKLEYLLADARARGCDTVITCGGEQSNHCRATAMAATKIGMASRLILRTDDPGAPPATRGNILLDQLAGASVRWISRAEWSDRAALMADEAERLAGEGRTAYVIPEGGSNEVGSWGYVAATEELVEQLAELPAKQTTVVYACGSGGTGAGLILGAKLLGAGHAVAGVNVCDDADYFVRGIGRICAAFDERYGTAAGVTADDIDIVDGYVGLGYARSRPEELHALRDLARREAVVLDPVYTGKAFFGLHCELAKNPRRFGERVVFLHTGGIFGLFPVAAQLAPLL